ncbi:zinc-ribbon domain-containing protein [uncultured Allomuricauda sp.]|uniref:zinc-ribbon domain-containing protein n=1 Tax=Flagellimonas sp. W118 TaxID=3410791 RepID=UPI0026197D16|nr:zinc-ribbon domain-containing protein [uncultured Allomuricauda sp.]
MILFFGTKLGKKETKTLHNVSCPHCAQTGTLNAVSQPSYAHLFWIPIIKLKTSQFAECSHCKRGFYKEEFTSEMERAL